MFNPEEQLRLNYIRHRRLATFILLIMGGLTFINYFLIYRGYFPNHVGWHALRAGTQAGFIGGIADWFAVTALFKHPLGLPIPHTAILPKQQHKLGKGIGRFIAHYIFTQQDIEKAIIQLDCSNRITNYLSKPKHVEYINTILLSFVPKLLNHFETGHAHDILNKIMVRLLEGESLSPLLIRLLKTLTNNDHYQEIVSFLLVNLKNTLLENEENLKQLIQDRVKEQGGKVLGWMIGSSIANKVLSSLSYEIDHIDPTDPHIKETVIRWINKEIHQFESDPALSARLSESLKRFIYQDSVKNWREDIWQRFKIQIETDIKDSNGWMSNLIKDLILYSINLLNNDSSRQNRLNEMLKTIFLPCFPYLQEWIVEFTQNVITQWNTQSLIDKLECRIGKDLQYIRINGSIVGFLVGVILYLITYLFFGNNLI